MFMASAFAVLIRCATRYPERHEKESVSVGPNGTPGPWIRNDAGTDSRRIEFKGLNPGTLNNLQVRAVGGSTGHSGWSNTVQHRSL